MSDIRAGTISDAAGTGPITLTGQSAAKAWVNFFNTSGGGVRNSLNVSSVTDVNVGVNTINLSSGMSGAYNATFHAILSTNYPSVAGSYASGRTSTTCMCNTADPNPNTSWSDNDQIDATIHGDLA